MPQEVLHVQPMDDEEVVEKDFYERGRKRTPLGSLSTITGLFGLTAANEAIRLIATLAGSGV